MKEFETKELNPMDKAVQMARAIQHFDKVVAIYKDQSTFENALETAKRELGVDANELDGFSGYAKCGYDDNNRECVQLTQSVDCPEGCKPVWVFYKKERCFYYD